MFKTSNHDIKIVLGDMNAKVYNDNSGYQRTMPQQGCRTMNDF